LGRGFHLYAELLKSDAVRIQNGSLEIKKPVSPEQGKCCLKKMVILGLIFFWYSPTYMEYRLRSDMVDI
jgi:hypothetical protein